MRELLCIDTMDVSEDFPMIHVGEVYHYDGYDECPQCKGIVYFLTEFPVIDRDKWRVLCTCGHIDVWEFKRPNYEARNFVDISEEALEEAAAEIDELVYV